MIFEHKITSMKINKKISIYLNYQTAHIIDFTNNPMEIKTIASDFTHDEKMETLNNAEITMHHKEQMIVPKKITTLYTIPPNDVHVHHKPLQTTVLLHDPGCS